MLEGILIRRASLVVIRKSQESYSEAEVEGSSSPRTCGFPYDLHVPSVFFYSTQLLNLLGLGDMRIRGESINS